MTVNAPVRRSLANTELHPSCNVLLIAPRFNGQSFWNFSAACEVHGAKFPAPPLGQRLGERVSLGLGANGGPTSRTQAHHHV